MNPAIAAAQQRMQAAATTQATGTPAVVASTFSAASMTENLLKLPSLLQLKDAGYEHTLIYGPPGSGKTLAAGMLAEFFNILWFDGDKGMSALRNNLPPELLSRIVPIVIPDTSDTPLYFNTMYQVITGRKLNICFSHGVKDCPICKKDDDAPKVDIALNALPTNWIVVMDSQTQYVASATAHSIRKALGLQAGKETPMDYKMQRDDWGLLKNIMDSTGSFIKDLRCNFIAISHETMVEQEDKTMKLVGVAGSENSSKNFAKNYDSVVFARMQNGKHAYSSSSTYSQIIQTKTRSNVALEKEAIPALLHLFRPEISHDLLKGSFTEWFYKGQDPKVKFTVKDILPSSPK